MHNNNVRLDLIENMLNDEIDSDNEEDYGQQTQRETKEIEIDETAAEKKLRYLTFFSLFCA